MKGGDGRVELISVEPCTGRERADEYSDRDGPIPVLPRVRKIKGEAPAKPCRSIRPAGI